MWIFHTLHVKEVAPSLVFLELLPDQFLLLPPKESCCVNYVSTDKEEEVDGSATGGAGELLLGVACSSFSRGIELLVLEKVPGALQTDVMSTGELDPIPDGVTL